MATQINFHGKEFKAFVEGYPKTDKSHSFVAFVIEPVDTYGNYDKTMAQAVFYISTIADADRILEAAKELADRVREICDAY